MRAGVAVVVLVPAACTSVSTVREQPAAVHARRPGRLRPIAAIQVDAMSAGETSLDGVVNQLLVVTAKAMDAGKVTDVQLDTTPAHGIWAVRRPLGWRSAHASGIAA